MVTGEWCNVGGTHLTRPWLSFQVEGKVPVELLSAGLVQVHRADRDDAHQQAVVVEAGIDAGDVVQGAQHQAGSNQ